MKKNKIFSKIFNISLSSFLIVSLCFCCIISLKPQESYSAFMNDNVSCVKLFDNISGYVSSQNVIKHDLYTFNTADEYYLQNPYYYYTTLNIQYGIDEDSPYYNNLNGMLLYLSEPLITDSYPLYVLSNICDSVYINVSYISYDHSVTLTSPHDYYMTNPLLIECVKPVYSSDTSLTNVYYINFGDSFNPQDEVYINVRFSFISQVSKWSLTPFGNYSNFITEITQGENSDWNFLHCNFLTYDENAIFSSDDAFAMGYEKGRIDTQKYMQGLIANAREQGYNEGLSAQGSFWSYFASIGEAPLTILKQMFDIEILGVSMNTFVFSILGALAVIKIIRLFI